MRHHARIRLKRLLGEPPTLLHDNLIDLLWLPAPNNSELPRARLKLGLRSLKLRDTCRGSATSDSMPPGSQPVSPNVFGHDPRPMTYMVTEDMRSRVDARVRSCELPDGGPRARCSNRLRRGPLGARARLTGARYAPSPAAELRTGSPPSVGRFVCVSPPWLRYGSASAVFGVGLGPSRSLVSRVCRLVLTESLPGPDRADPRR